jgi:hypothetical protein
MSKPEAIARAGLAEQLRISDAHMIDPAHTPPPFPEGVWPHPDAQADAATWRETINLFHADLDRMAVFLADPAFPLFETKGKLG